jgi:hypothetical protein
MWIFSLCGLQDFAHGLFNAESILYWIGALTASACSGRHGTTIVSRTKEK